MKKYDIYLGKNGGYHTYRIAPSADSDTLNRWLDRGYRVASEHQIGVVLHEVYLVKSEV
jgi:hypothetical protein